MSNDNPLNELEGKRDILLLYGTQKGTSKQFTETLYNQLIINNSNKNIAIKNMKDFDAEDLEKESIVIMINAAAAARRNSRR